MRKKRKSKQKPVKQEAVKPEGSTNSSVQSSEEEKPFDFGGLPNRDLKKNLGCG